MIKTIITGLTIITSLSGGFCKGVNPKFIQPIELINNNIEYQKNLKRKNMIKEMRVSLGEQIKKKKQEERLKQKQYDEACYFNPNDVREISNISKDKINELLEGSSYHNNQDVIDKIYEAERLEPSVNAVILISLVRHESGHGNSQLVSSHNNTSGMRSRSGGWQYYDSVADSIRDTTRLLSEHYLNPNDKFYFNGYSLWDIQKRYCPEGNWADKIINVANNLK